METLRKLVGQEVVAVSCNGTEIETGFLSREAPDAGRFRIATKEACGIEGLYFDTYNIEKIEGNKIFFRPFI